MASIQEISFYFDTVVKDVFDKKNNRILEFRKFEHDLHKLNDHEFGALKELLEKFLENRPQFEDSDQPESLYPMPLPEMSQASSQLDPIKSIS